MSKGKAQDPGWDGVEWPKPKLFETLLATTSLLQDLAPLLLKPDWPLELLSLLKDGLLGRFRKNSWPEDDRQATTELELIYKLALLHGPEIINQDVISSLIRSPMFVSGFDEAVLQLLYFTLDNLGWTFIARESCQCAVLLWLG